MYVNGSRERMEWRLPGTRDEAKADLNYSRRISSPGASPVRWKIALNLSLVSEATKNGSGA